MKKIIVLIFCIISLLGCSEKMKSFGSQILSSTGVVSSGEANTLFSNAEKLADATSSLDAQQEYYLGRGVAALVLGRYRPYNKLSTIKYVNLVGKTVASASTAPQPYTGYHFLVLDTPELNAVSAPGGFVFVSRGFIEALPNEDALAAVLAHEIAHVVHRDGVSAIRQGKITEALTALGKEAAQSRGGYVTQQLTTVFGSSVEDVFNTVMSKGYSRSQEYDADETAVELLKASKYDPASFSTVLNVLDSHRPKGSSNNGWFKTHPEPKDRLDELEDQDPPSEVLAQAEAVREKRFLAFK